MRNGRRIVTAEDFLAAITDDKSDLLPRLAYADFLEERAGMVRCSVCNATGASWGSEGKCLVCHGTGSIPDGNAARAEFIRCQVELAAMLPVPIDAANHRCGISNRELILDELTPLAQPGRCPRCDWHRKRQTLRRRERELLGHERWFVVPELSISTRGHWIDANGREIEFQTGRGFVERISCGVAAWLAHGPEIVRAAPVISVLLTGLQARISSDPAAVAMWFASSSFYEGDDVASTIPEPWYRLLDAPYSGWCGSRPFKAFHAYASLLPVEAVALRWARSETRGGTLRTMPEWTPLTERASVR